MPLPHPPDDRRWLAAEPVLDDAFDAFDEPCAPVRHSARRRAVALLVALVLFGISLLAAGYSLFRGPPAPKRTRPLPEYIPEPGAIHR